MRIRAGLAATAVALAAAPLILLPGSQPAAAADQSCWISGTTLSGCVFYQNTRGSMPYAEIDVYPGGDGYVYGRAGVVSGTANNWSISLWLAQCTFTPTCTTVTTASYSGTIQSGSPATARTKIVSGYQYLACAAVVNHNTGWSLPITSTCSWFWNPNTASPQPTATPTPTATARPTATPTTKPTVTPTSTPTPSSNVPTLAGCQLFPADNPWREDISSLPVASQSNTWIANYLGGYLHPDFGTQSGIPYITVPASQPKAPITFTAYGDQSDPGPYPIPANAPVEAGSDHHVLVASADCHLYELYDASKDATDSGWSAESGAIFNLNSDALRPSGWTSADAAGLPILPGLVRKDEVDSGVIRHALRFTLSHTYAGFISPATHFASDSTNPILAPMGARFRLKASFDISGYTGAARVILQALKTYGMFLADNGSNFFLSGTNDPTWDDTNLNTLKTVPTSAFEVVQTGAIQTG